MRATDTTHPAAEQLQAFALGQLPPQAEDEVARHVAECSDCCEALRKVPDDTLLGKLRNAPPAESPDVPPELVDHRRYRILARLGEGGMGTVYKAEHRIMERVVALKVISPHLLANKQAIDRFHQEARAAARLNHPNIVTAHDADQAGGLHFLVMEYVEGINLARLVEKKGPLPVSHACHFARQTALGLQHAHEQGMVHRDIKPHNLMVTRKGQVKILDFGLARLARTETSPETRGPARALTAVDVVLGTPDYLAPEQAHNSRDVDARADLYSLGCTLYFLLTGRVPFPGGSSLEKLLAQCQDEPTPLQELRPDVPAEVAEVVSRLMAKKPEQRYQTAGEVANALTPLARVSASIEQSLPMLTAAVEAAAETPHPAVQKTQKLRTRAGGSTQAFPPPRETSPRRKGRKRRFPVRPVLLAGAGLVMLIGLTIYLTSQDGKNPGRAGKPRVLFVLPSTNFFWPDYSSVREALEKGGAEVKVASRDGGTAYPIQTEHIAREKWGKPISTDLKLSQARSSDFDAILFCGGKGVFSDFVKDEVNQGVATDLINAALKEKKPVGAICMGPVVLARAGVLRDRKVTAHKWERETRAILDAAKANVLDRDVVEDGLIITAQDDSAAVKFVERVLRAIR
jgi:eukaryotic-like serine/threonine-protein kinase